MGKTLEFKYIRKGENLDLEWQVGSNRKFQTIEGVSLLVVNEPWESLDSVDSIVEELIDFKDSVTDSIDSSEEIVNTRDPTKDIANAIDLVEEIANENDLVEEVTNASDLIEEIAITTNEPSKRIANQNELPNHIVQIVELSNDIANTVDSSNDILEQSEPNGALVSLDAINSNGGLVGDVIEAVVGEVGDAKINGQSSVLEKDVIETGILEGKDARASGQVSVLEEDVIEEAAYTSGIPKLQTTIAMAEDSNGSSTSVNGTTEAEIVAKTVEVVTSQSNLKD